MAAFGALMSLGCVRVSSPAPASPDLSFCAIAEQSGRPKPTLVEIASLKGRYRVRLYSADSGKLLDELDITLTATDTLRRFYQTIVEPGGHFSLEKRKDYFMAYGGERHRKWKSNPDMPPVALYFSDKPVLALFAPPHCEAGSCSIEGWQMGMLMYIKNVVGQGFSGTVDQIGTVSGMGAPGQPWRLVGPHFFCALKEG